MNTFLTVNRSFVTLKNGVMYMPLRDTFFHPLDSSFNPTLWIPNVPFGEERGLEDLIAWTSHSTFAARDIVLIDGTTRIPFRRLS